MKVVCTIYDCELGFKKIPLPETLSILQRYNDRNPSLRLLGSIDGLLVFEEVGYHARGSFWTVEYPKRILILNPITGETRVIGYPEGHFGYVCGIFFDRFQQQHTLLHVSKKTKPFPEIYHIFSLTGTAWRRTQISYTTPFSSLARASRVPPCMHNSLPPVIVGDTLHWLVDAWEDHQREEHTAVMALKIQSNRIHCFRHPFPFAFPRRVLSFCEVCGSTEQSDQENRQLIEHNGKLCFCHIVGFGEFDLWSLEEEWSWVKKFKYNLPHVANSIDSLIFGSDILTSEILRSFQIQLPRIFGPIILSFPHKDIVAIMWKENWIYLYHLHLDTNEPIRIKDGPLVQADFANYRFIVFNKTLLSPNIA